jgi:hypothetical protein
MFDAIYQVQTFAMLFSSGDLNECEVGFSVLPGRDMTPWPGVGQSVAIRPVNPLKSQSQMNGPFVNHSFSNSSFGAF